MNDSSYLNVPGTLDGKTIVLGITGGIAAYKSAELVRLLTKRGAEIQVVMTANACRFIQPLTFQALTHRPVIEDMFKISGSDGLRHTALADEADLTVVAPATANIVGKYASGIADDFLSTFLLAVDTPVIIAPAMNPRMYRHPAVQANLETLIKRGVVVIEPDTGDTACGHHGKGRLAAPQTIVDHISAELGKVHDLKGKQILVTAGPTRESIDPVRFISNRSSGLMGYQIAAAAIDRGASVTLVSGPVALEPHSKARLIPVVSAREMYSVVMKEAPDMDAVIMSAAVADWEPKTVFEDKWKKSGEEESQLLLKRTPDILKELGRKPHSFILVGFAAESTDLIANAERKMNEKNVDILVANDISQTGVGFQSLENEVLVLGRSKPPQKISKQNKRYVADAILDRIIELFPSK